MKLPTIEVLLNHIFFWRSSPAETPPHVDFDWENDPYYVSLGVKIDTNKEGIVGESYVSTLFSLGNMYVEFLGDKAPDVDCLISFKNGCQIYEFLLQIKSTQGETTGVKSICSGMSKDGYERLQSYHLPSYFARVVLEDVPKIYIKGAFNPVGRSTYSTIPTKYCLSLENITESRRIMDGIATDVRKYWDNSMEPTYKKNFKTYFQHER